MEVMDIKAEKVCRDCHTRTTPLWRAGPDGPRSLCNACGLRFRKRRALLGMDREGALKRRKRIPTSRSMKQYRSIRKQKKLKEEEEAAMLLMALSCGSLST